MYFSSKFGSLLDENAGSKFDNIGLNAMANTDKAGETDVLKPADELLQTKRVISNLLCLLSKMRNTNRKSLFVVLWINYIWR